MTTPDADSRVQPHFSGATMRAFEFFFRPWRERRLITRMLDLPDSPADGAPLILVANHTSWWDGFLLRDIQRTLRPHGSLYSVMTAHELRRNPFLRRIGAVPLEQRSAGSVLRMLRSLRHLARGAENVTISYFPQGRITPAWQRPLGFLRGVELLARVLRPCWIMPVGIHIEPLNRTRPTAFVSAGSPFRTDDSNVRADELEAMVTARLDHVAATLTDHAPAAWQEEYA